MYNSKANYYFISILFDVDTKNVKGIDWIIDKTHAFDGFVICRR